jgi:hypothetical protein
MRSSTGALRGGSPSSTQPLDTAAAPAPHWASTAGLHVPMRHSPAMQRLPVGHSSSASHATSCGVSMTLFVSRGHPLVTTTRAVRHVKISRVWTGCI